MTKIYSKSDLDFVNGYIVDKKTNEVIALPSHAAEQLNDLETMIQKVQYLADQPEPQPLRSLDGFKRKSALDKDRIKVTAETPELDKRRKISATILDEIRKKDKADSINETIEKFQEAFDFLMSDTFVSDGKIVRLDLPTIGNPLEVDVSDLLATIASAMD